MNTHVYYVVKFRAKIHLQGTLLMESEYSTTRKRLHQGFLRNVKIIFSVLNGETSLGVRFSESTIQYVRGLTMLFQFNKTLFLLISDAN